MIKNSNSQLRHLLIKLFNLCLSNGIYPWNTSLTTPLHKKGDRYDPDNYRAITVGSCLGKLFSSMLLNRLVEFRNARCPDYPNQLGFRSGAQCNDHILTLSTLIEKYVTKGRGKLFVCFVDYRKAFDSVCREALLFKLSKLGISGQFFECINYMYHHSTTRIKLIQKISAAIDITVGTEQGHPMSPELFKMFLYDLSTELEELSGISIPNLNGFNISHLLWADDLILAALDEKSLQKLLDVLSSFVERWELSINIAKTNIMVFNRASRILNCSYGFHLCGKQINPTKSYCYLGIVFSLNGSFKTAIDHLSCKALRSYFSIKRMVDTRALSTSSQLKLLDSLVKPVASYGCQVWLHSTNIIKGLISNTGTSLPNLAAKDKLETVHLKMLKWTLGVHKRTTNNTCYGETGRLPLALSVLPQCIDYFDRVLSTASTYQYNPVNTLLFHTLEEQRTNNFDWYRSWNTIINSVNSQAAGTRITPTRNSVEISNSIRNLFIKQWYDSISKQSKLSFYCSIKLDYKEETYLSVENRAVRTSLAKLRTSSHDLNVERGRYLTSTQKNTASPNNLIYNRLCRFCCHQDPNISTTLKYAEHLPFFTPVIETEHHALVECPAYHHLRLLLSDEVKSLLISGDICSIMDNLGYAYELGLFTLRCEELRKQK